MEFLVIIAIFLFFAFVYFTIRCMMDPRQRFYTVTTLYITTLWLLMLVPRVIALSLVLWIASGDGEETLAIAIVAIPFSVLPEIAAIIAHRAMKLDAGSPLQDVVALRRLRQEQFNHFLHTRGDERRHDIRRMTGLLAVTGCVNTAALALYILTKTSFRPTGEFSGEELVSAILSGTVSAAALLVIYVVYYILSGYRRDSALPDPYSAFRPRGHPLPEQPTLRGRGLATGKDAQEEWMKE